MRKEDLELDLSWPPQRIVDAVRAYCAHARCARDASTARASKCCARTSTAWRARHRRIDRAESRRDDRRGVSAIAHGSAARMNARDVALAHGARRLSAAAGGNPERGAQEALDYRARKAELDAARPRVRDRARLRLDQDAAHARLVSRAVHRRAQGAVAAGDSRDLAPGGLRARLHARRRTRDGLRVRQPRQALRSSRRRQSGQRGAALVSARPAVSDRSATIFDTDDDYLGTRYSLPTWLVRQWRATLRRTGRSDLRGRQRCRREPAITVNALRTSVRRRGRALCARRRRSRSRSPYVAESLLCLRRRLRALA